VARRRRISGLNFYDHDMVMAYTLELLTPCDDEFHEIVKLCGLPYNENDAVPLVIEKIHNKKLQEAFDSRVAKITAQTGSVPIIRFPMYHGTNEAASKAIAANGFDVTKSHVAAYNKGTYIARDYTYSTNGYAKNDSYGSQFLFVCRVIEGRTCIGTPNGITDTSKYESATNSNGSIVSSPYNDGVLPLYFIRWFRKIPAPTKLSSTCY
jgi:Poly(ADP-ribose) polymerase catalytic domain